ncbi:MAG TPA: transcriptional regulator [Rhodospirillaceae bacterium]|nr:transcriptional regulator [Rhodospirillaceae bacterium]HAA90931.1 transcriptional regulator [Rhodospirillaceae bacterium]HAT34492.1 transcriptional regulator [Rhodospirillaceae bacterium]|tara:strand:- start:147 stop:1259 length:1113 start_codon:yes stop_codon:yes gene_type:complete
MAEMQVPFVDLKARYQEERDQLMEIFDRVLSSGHLVMTPEIAEFEEEVQKYTGARHCVSLNSGTDALLMSLWALDVGQGDEVITTPVSFIATVGAIIHVGAKPVYVDVLDDQNIDPDKIEEAITPRTKAIMPVHWTGRIADMHAIDAIAKRHNLVVIEDSAQCMGSYFHGQHGGTFGSAGAISTHPLKNLNAVGDGGFVLTNDDDVADKIRLKRNHGLASRDDAVIYGLNSRLDVLNAEVLKFRLTRLKEVIDTRKKHADMYRELIKTDAVFIPEDKDFEINSYVMFITQAENRDALKDHLAKKGIESLVYYGTPLHLHTAAKDQGYQRGDFPIAEAQCEKVLALPHNQCLSEDQIAYTADAVNAFYGSG